MQKAAKPNDPSEYKNFEAVVAQDYVLYDFGYIGQEILRQDQTELYRLIDESVYEIQVKHNQGLLDLVYRFKNSLSYHFASRPLYVLFEKELNCNVETDHLAPKNVYPLFGPFLEKLFDEVYNFVRAFVCHELVLSADKINWTARRIMTETLETNELLLVKLLFNYQESQKFKDLFDTNVTKFVNQEQNLKRYIYMLREQVRQASVIGKQFQADFGREKNAALEYKDNVIFSTDRLKQLYARNLQLEKEVVRLSGELDKLRSSEDRLQSFARHAIEVEYAFQGAYNEMVERSLLLQYQNARIDELLAYDESRQQVLELYEQRLIMYRDDPADVATSAVEYLDDKKLAEKFAPRPECREQDAITELRLYDLDNIDYLQHQISYLENELAKYEGKSFKRFDSSDKCFYIDDAFSKQQTAALRLYQSQILSFQQKADADKKELERLSYLIQQRAEQLGSQGGMEQYARALSAGLRSLRVREVECYTNVEEVAVFDPSERLQEFVAQNEELMVEIEKKLTNKALKKEAKQKGKERYGVEARNGFELIFRNIETGRLYDCNYRFISENRKNSFERLADEKCNEDAKVPLYSQNLQKSSYYICSKTAIENVKTSLLKVCKDKTTLESSSSVDNTHVSCISESNSNEYYKRQDDSLLRAQYIKYSANSDLDAMVDCYFALLAEEKTDFQDRIQVYDRPYVSKAMYCDSLPGQDKTTETPVVQQKYLTCGSETEREIELLAENTIQQQGVACKGQIFTFMDAYLDKQRNFAKRTKDIAKLRAETVLYAERDNLSREYVDFDANQCSAFVQKCGNRAAAYQHKASVKQLPDDGNTNSVNLRYLYAVNEHLPRDQQIGGTESVFDTLQQLRLSMYDNEGCRNSIIAETYELQLQYWKKVFTAQELRYNGKNVTSPLIPIELRTYSYEKAGFTKQSLLPGINRRKDKENQEALLRQTEVEPSLKSHRHYLLNVRAASTDINLSKSARLPETSLLASRGMVGRALSQKK